MLTRRRTTTEFSYAVAVLTALVAAGWTLAGAIDGEDNTLRTASIEDAVKWTATCEMGWIAIRQGRRMATLVLVWQGSNNDPECVISDIVAPTIETVNEVSAVVDRVTASLDEEI